MIDIRSVQQLAWENKLPKGFNTTDAPLEFCLLNGEAAEAFDAWRKGRPDLAEELADAVISAVAQLPSLARHRATCSGVHPRGPHSTTRISPK